MLLCVVKVINYAITDNKKMEKFVATGGLKYIFPYLPRKGASEDNDTRKEEIIEL